MALQINETLGQNAMLNAINTAVTSAGCMSIWTGSQPATCGQADGGSELAWWDFSGNAFAAASGGAMAKTGTWQEDSAIADGTAGHFRIYNDTHAARTESTDCVMQGSCGIGTGDLQFDNTSIATGQVVTVSTFTLTAGNDS